MRNIITIAVAVLIMAAAVPMRAQDFNRLNDTTWVRHTLQKDGVITEYAYAVDQAAHMATLNNSMRNTANLLAGSIGSAALASAAAYINYNNGNKNAFLKASTLVFGMASVAMSVVGIVELHQERVYLSPEGVVIRIGKIDKPKPKEVFSK